MIERGAKIRMLRVQLAKELSAATDTDGHPRTQEAVEQLRRAQDENGAVPTDAEIGMDIADLTEASDPVGALRVYLHTLDSECRAQAADRATALLAKIDGSALRELPAGELKLAQDAARRGGDPETVLLASALLHACGQDVEALSLLDLANFDGTRLRDDALGLRSEVLLNLDRFQDALDIVHIGVGKENVSPRLRAVHLRIHLLRGEFGEAAQDADDVHVRYPALCVEDYPDLCVATALAYLGVGRCDEALNALESLESGHPVRVMVLLAQRAYVKAREETQVLLRRCPDDVDAQMLSAQVAFEGLGHGIASAEVADSDVAGELAVTSVAQTSVPRRSVVDELNAARARLDEIIDDLDDSGWPTAWQYRVQKLARNDDGRYQFFRIESDAARHVDTAIDQLDAVDRTTTTVLQDSVLAERKGDLLRRAGDATLAAAAYEEAAANFWQCAYSTRSASDYGRALKNATSCYELEPNQSRATTRLQLASDQILFIEQAEGSSAEQVDESLELLEQVTAQAEQWLPKTSEEDLPGSLLALAWARTRLAESALRDRWTNARRAVLWGLAAGICNEEDAEIHAALAWRLNDIGASAGALAVARHAYRKSPESAFVEETVVAMTANYHTDFEEIRDLLRDADPAGRNSIEVHTCLGSGARDRLGPLLNQPLSEEYWAVGDRALAKALLGGISPAHTDLSEAIEAAKRAHEPLTAVLPCLLIGEDPSACFAEADKLESPTRAIALARADADFHSDRSMSAEEYVQRCFNLVRAPVEAGFILNVSLPLLSAARSADKRNLTQPVAPIAVAEPLPCFVQPGPEWTHDLDPADSLVISLARLWSASVLEGSLPSTRAAADALRDLPSSEMPASLLCAIASLARRTVLAKTVAGLVRAIIEPRPGVNSANSVGSLNSADQPTADRLALGVLVSREDSMMLEYPPAIGDIEKAALDVVVASREILSTPAQWWCLYDHFELVVTEDSSEGTVAAAVQVQLVDVLTDLLGVNSTSHPAHSHFCQLLGSAFIPEDTGADWVLIRDLLPAMRERILADTGFDVPGSWMWADPNHADILRILVNAMQFSAVRLPTSGRVRFANADESGDYVDPLTSTPVVVEANPVDRGGSAPEEAVKYWTPLEFLVRHLEAFVRHHSADLISTVDLINYAGLAGSAVAEAVVSDAVCYTLWSDAVREAAPTGELRNPRTSRCLIEARSRIDSRMKDLA